MTKSLLLYVKYLRLRGREISKKMEHLQVRSQNKQENVCFMCVCGCVCVCVCRCAVCMCVFISRFQGQ